MKVTIISNKSGYKQCWYNNFIGKSFYCAQYAINGGITLFSKKYYFHHIDIVDCKIINSNLGVNKMNKKKLNIKASLIKRLPSALKKTSISIKPKSFKKIKPFSVFSKIFIPFLKGRPNRDKIINQNDIMNLRIALNTDISEHEFFTLI